MDSNGTRPDGRPLAKDGTNRGRPLGSVNRRMNQAQRDAAAAEGELPHEILLRISRGHPVKLWRLDRETGERVRYEAYPTLDDVQECAKAAAPYYAPKLSTVETIQGISDADLDRFIARAAAEAGIGLAAGGEGEEGEEGAGRGAGEDAAHGERRRARHRVRDE